MITKRTLVTKVFSYFILIYLFLSIPSRFLSPNKELFPFFAFTLYTKTPSTISRGTILVTELNHRKIDPINVYDSLSLIRLGGGYLRHFMGVYMKSKNSNNLKMVEEYETMIRNEILSDSVTDYKIVLEVFDPYLRLKDKRHTTYKRID